MKLAQAPDFAIIKRCGEGFETSPAPNRNGSSEDHVMAYGQLPPVSYLRQRLVYDADAGTLTWLSRDLSDFGNSARARHLHKVWNDRFAGKIAGRVTGGRRSIRIDGKDWWFSRVAFSIYYGAHPTGDIDHINGDPMDNRICNIRDVSRAINNRNRAVVAGSSGLVGVEFVKRTGRWRASMNLQNRSVHIGYYATKEEAFNARIAAQAGHGFTDRHLGT
jgi:hypothetical protein